MFVSHHWPGITPFNVWDLTVELWLRYAEAADKIIRQQEEGP